MPADDPAQDGVLAGRPLSPWTYLLRNPRRVGPVFAIQGLVTGLLVLIITPPTAFETTARANLEPLRTFTIVTPRLQRDFDEELLGLLDANPGLAQRTAAKMLWLRMPMIVGDGFAPLVALPEDLWPAFLSRLGIRLVEGRMPERGGEGAVLHEAVVRARGMRLGDEFGQLVDPKDSTPGRFKLVGILAGRARVGLADYAYTNQPFFVLARRDPFQLVYAADGRKDESDAYLREARKPGGERAFRVIDHAFVRSRMDETFRNLPLVIGFITASVAAVVALVIALLNVIAFQVRVDEFGLFLAIGHPRARLVRKLAVETGIVALASWLAGLGVGIGGVALYEHVWLAPKGILMEILDGRPLLFSLSVPALSTLTGAVALARRLRRMDPVAVIQRRGT